MTQHMNKNEDTEKKQTKQTHVSFASPWDEEYVYFGGRLRGRPDTS